MQAVTVRRHGGPEAMELLDADDLSPGPGQIVVRASTAGVNFIDLHQRAGRYPVPVAETPRISATPRAWSRSSVATRGVTCGIVSGRPSTASQSSGNDEGRRCRLSSRVQQQDQSALLRRIAPDENLLVTEYGPHLEPPT